jgi:hypothetical protein
MAEGAYDRLITLLDSHDASYRRPPRPPPARTWAGQFAVGSRPGAAIRSRKASTSSAVPGPARAARVNRSSRLSRVATSSPGSASNRPARARAMTPNGSARTAADNLACTAASNGTHKPKLYGVSLVGYNCCVMNDSRDVPATELRANLAAFLDEARSGVEFRITRGSRVAARLVPPDVEERSASPEVEGR